MLPYQMANGYLRFSRSRAAARLLSGLSLQTRPTDATLSILKKKKKCFAARTTSYDLDSMEYVRDALAGNVDAQYKLALCYQNGAGGVAVNKEEAFKWYKLAAEAGGGAGAMSDLGACYANGVGVAVDMNEAVKWFRIAAEMGHAGAQFNMGLCYAEGTGVSVDMGEAVKWYERAAEAEAGNEDAFFSLGVCYANGTGVAVNKDEAFRWYKRAAKAGHKFANDALAQISFTDANDAIAQISPPLPPAA